MIKYTDLGSDLQLNEIVIAGSHDAGITSGGANAQTQDLNILKQAQVGVRFFDIRVAAFATGMKSYGAKQVELKAFHADGMLHKKEDKTRSVVGVHGTRDLVRSKLKGGAQGMGLRKMLADAKSFVESADFSGEFLILKFDKCTNWPIIAETCRDVLGDKIYADGGNINTKTLTELGGKVIVAFMPAGYGELNLPAERVGITRIKNLFKPPAGYVDNFIGLQYWGAGGTGINNSGFEQKIAENVEKQKSIMKKASTGVAPKYTKIKRQLKSPGCTAADPNAMGMMYWTTTGVFKSIKDRDAVMWDDDHRGGLDEIWTSGFDNYIENAVPANIDLMSFSSGGTLKLFMPNIVMIDFAEQGKCDHIYGLNTIAAVKLVKTCQKLDIHGGRHSG